MKFLLISILFFSTPFYLVIGLIAPEYIKGEEIQITIKQAKSNKESYRLNAVDNQKDPLHLGNKKSYKLDITTRDNQNIPLNLKHLDKSIFSTGFTFGNSTWHNSILTDIEREIYVDQSQNTILHISSETPFVQGYSRGKLINHASNGKHYMFNGNTIGCGVTGDDHVHVPHTDSSTSNKKETASLKMKNDLRNAEAIVEVVAVFDRALYSALGNSELEATIYAAMMFHVVNIIYSNMVAPTLEVKLAGVRILTQSEDTTIVQNTNHNIYQMLPEFERWLYSNPSGVGPNDVAALVTGVVTLDNEGTDTTHGLAYRDATCGTAKVSVSRDVGAFFQGIFNVAHEIGHNMGAVHDFNTTCGSESKGHIMDYEWTTFGLSECSKQSIRDRINTAEGNCLLQENAGTGIGLGPSPGQVISMEQQCKFRIESGNYGTYTGYSQPNPAEECLILNCHYLRPDMRPYVQPFRFPLEGTPCTSTRFGGKCSKGRCV